MWPKVKSVLAWIWTPPMVRRRAWQRWSWRVGGVVILLILSVPLIVLPLAESIVIAKLQEAVAANTKARLEIDSIHYAPPLSVTLDGIRLIADGPDGQPMAVLDVPQVQVHLAGLLNAGSEIASVEIDQPTAQLVRLPSGELWIPSLGARQSNAPAGVSAPSSPGPSPSFRLDQFSLNGGRLIVRDGSSTHQWLNVSVDAAPIDLANGDISVPKLHLTALGDGSDAGIGGSLTLDASGMIPQDPRLAKFDASLAADASSERKGHAKLSLAAHGADGKISVEFDQLQTTGMGSRFAMTNKPTFQADLVAHTWHFGPLTADADPGSDPSQLPPYWQEKLNELQLHAPFKILAVASGALPQQAPATTADWLALVDPSSRIVIDPRSSLYAQLPNWHHHFEITSDSPDMITIDRDAVKIDRLNVAFGLDRLTLQTVRIPLAGFLQKHPAIQPAIDARLKFDSLAPALPPDIQRYFFDRPPDGILDLVIDGVKWQQSRLSGGNMQLGLGQSKMEVKSIDITLSDTGAIGSCDVSITTVDLKEIRQTIHYPDPQGKMAGIASSDIRMEFHTPAPGEPAIDGIDATGSVQVDGADMFDISVFGIIAQKTGVPLEQVGRIGQAAAIFNVHKGILHFDKLAVNSPALGIAGSGDWDLVTGKLDQTLVAQVLGDWQSKGAGIPVVGQILGTIQNGLNQFSGKYLYNFHVGGTIGDPQIEPRVLPGLNVGQLNLFAAMQSLGSTGGRLLDQLKKGQDNQGK